jgi:flagellum-specific peptidoglycan hydrolase FlgJ
LAALGIFLWKMDYGFGLMPITKAQGQHAALLMPEMDVEAVHVNFRETRTKPSKAREQAPKEKTVQTKGDIDGLNLANEATATSNALSPQQKEAAARISNLSIALDPDFARRKNLDPAVVREKMRICRQYIQTYLETAREEARKFNIPVAITLAQGLLESNAGESRLAVKANNHFGIKCFSRTCDKGHCMNATDDSHKDFFVVFGSGTESFRARSKFLCKDRYKHLLQLKRTEYKKWAHGLKKAGYATDPNYARKLIALIENLKLYVYDQS